MQTSQPQTFTHSDGRTYTVTEVNRSGDLLAADLIRRGFDGACYIAEARPVGRQRVTRCGMFIREAGSGRFVAAY